MNTVTKKNKSITYKQAGVDIEAGNAFVAALKPLVRATARLGADAEIGGFGSIFDLAQLNYRDPLLVSTTDGVGTKLKIAQQVNKHNTIGIDLVAMCVNDLLVHGAQPLFFLDYFATGMLDNQIALQIIEGMVKGCKESDCALSGGETAEMPGMYAPGEYDLAGFAVGIVERENILPKTNKIIPGDLLIGIASSGLHASGFSLVRKLIEQENVNLYEKPPFESCKDYLFEELLEPTKIYIKTILPLVKKYAIKGMAHITGGGFLDNIPRILPENVCATIEQALLPRVPVFQWIQSRGAISILEMMRTFNNGVGMVLVCAPEYVQTIIQEIEHQNTSAFIIGSIQEKKSGHAILLR